MADVASNDFFGVRSSVLFGKLINVFLFASGVVMTGATTAEAFR
jgi:hypothetical protein